MTTLITGIDHVHLTAPNGSEARVRAFYVDVLGLREIPKPPSLQARGGVWFDCGNLQLHIGVEEAPDNERSRRHVAFQVDDLAAVRQRLNAHGVPIEEGAVPIEGVIRFYCRDAVGNRVEFAQAIRAEKPEAQDWLKRAEWVDEYGVGSGDVERVAVSQDGQWLAAGTYVEDVRRQTPSIFIWRSGETSEPEVVVEMPASVWELAFSPNGRELVGLTEDGSLETWRTGDFESEQFAELPERSSGLAYSDDGGLLAVGAGDTVVVFRPGLERLHTIQHGLDGVHALAFDPHGMLAVSGEALRIQLWQVRPIQGSSWELFGHESPAVQLRFHPAAPVLAAVTDAGQALLWNINEGPETPKTLGNEAGQVNALAFSPDGERLACGGDEGRVWLWDGQGEEIVSEIDVGAVVRALVFSSDGAQLVIGTEGGRVQVWRVR